jgi:hypothetical protein
MLFNLPHVNDIENEFWILIPEIKKDKDTVFYCYYPTQKKYKVSNVMNNKHIVNRLRNFPIYVNNKIWGKNIKFCIDMPIIKGLIWKIKYYYHVWFKKKNNVFLS